VKPNVFVNNFLKTNPVAARYMADGFFLGSAATVIASNQSLLAIRLGANDFQLSLLYFLPHIFSFIISIPGGFIIDNLYSRKKAVILFMLLYSFGVLCVGSSPFIKGGSIIFFLVSISLVGSFTALLNIAWMSYFPNIVDNDLHNRVLTYRLRILLILGILAPPGVGVILVSIKTEHEKIIAHQVFYAISALLIILAAVNYHKFRSVHPVIKKRLSFPEIKKVIKNLLHNKPYLLFTGMAMFFHITWAIDWTMWYIGQVQYLRYNEIQLGLVSMIIPLAQLSMLKFWSRKNEKYGKKLPVVFCMLGLSLCPLAMNTAVYLPHSIGQHVFLVLCVLIFLPYSIISLNFFQCLLQTVDKNNPGFSISVYNCLMCLPSAIMPMIGVSIYNALGGDLGGLFSSNIIVFGLRLFTAILWLMYWRLSL